jgi:hypothetical protein
MGKNYSDMQYRCAGPNCGTLKSKSDRWWLMWTVWDGKTAVLSLSVWDDNIAVQEGAMAVCGELCAHKLQSQFMDNVLRSRLLKTS